MSLPTPRERLAGTLLYGTLAVLLFAPLFLQHRVFFPLHTDLVQPWRASQTPEHREELEACFNPALTDQNFLFHPDTSLIVAQWRRGELPLWNSLLLGGVYQLGQALFGAFYPPNLLYLAFPRLEVAYGVLVLLHVVLACLGTFVFLRGAGLQRGSALVGGLLFGISGALVARYHYYMTFYPVTWIPWLLHAVRRYCVERRWPRLLWVVPPVALVILSGFPQTGFYGLYLAAGYGAYLLLRRGLRPGFLPLVKLGAAFAAGGLAAAVQLLPVADALGRSLPRVRSAAEQIRNAGSPTLPAGYLVPSLLVDPRQDWSVSWFTNPLWPAFYGHADDSSGTPVPRSLEIKPSITEDTCYAGALGLLLGIAGLFARPRRRALLCLGGLALCWAYALGVPAVVWFAHHFLPGAKIGDVRRILPTAALLLSLLGALGFESLFRSERARGGLPAILLGGAAVGALGVLWFTVHGLEAGELWSRLLQRVQERFGRTLELPDADVARIAPALQSFLESALGRAAGWFLGATALLAALWFLRRRLPPALPAVLVLLYSFLDLGAFHRGFNEFVPGEHFLAQEDPLIQSLVAGREAGRVHRFDSGPAGALNPVTDVVLPPNLAMHFGIQDTEGYIVSVPLRMARYLQALQGPEGVLTVLVLPLSTPAALTSPLLDAASIRFVLTREDLPELLRAAGVAESGLELRVEEGGNRVYENPDALAFATVLPEACFVPFAEEPEAQAVHEQVLAELAAGGDRFRRRVYLEGAPPAELPAAEHLADPGTQVAGATAARHGMAAREVSVEWLGAQHVRLHLEAGPGGFLLFTQGYDPGWKARIDGRPAPVYPANVAFQGLVVPDGARTVELDFEPLSARLGLWISVLVLGAWCVALGLSFRVRRGPVPAPTERR